MLVDRPVSWKMQIMTRVCLLVVIDMKLLFEVIGF